MKKDIFNGNIKKEYIGSVQFILIFSIVIWLGSFIFFLLMALLYDKIEFSARIFTFVISFLCFIASFFYPLVTLFAIKTYPRHPKLAKAMLKEYVFETNESRKNQIISHVFPMSWDLTTNDILSYIPSKEIRNYLLKNKENLTLMQYATLVENYYKGNRVTIFKILRNRSDNEYEKELFKLAAKDYRRRNYISDRTQNFYKLNDPRTEKPLCVFEEFIKLPTLLNDYDLATYYDDCNKKQLMVIVGKVYPFKVDDNTPYDFSDLSYMAYGLNYDKLSCKDDLFSIHLHVHYCDIEKIELSLLSQEQLKKYNFIKEFLEEIE